VYTSQYVDMKSSLWTFNVYLSLLRRVFEPFLGSLFVWHLLLFPFFCFQYGCCSPDFCFA